MKPRDQGVEAQIRAEIEAQHAWGALRDAAVAEMLRLVGARRAPEPIAFQQDPRYRIVRALMDHTFCGRTRDGVFMISETWRRGWDAGGRYFPIAREATKLGFKIALLPTRCSTRWAGERRPIVIVPPGSNIDPRAIFDALIAGNFKGVPTYVPP